MRAPNEALHRINSTRGICVSFTCPSDIESRMKILIPIFVRQSTNGAFSKKKCGRQTWRYHARLFLSLAWDKDSSQTMLVSTCKHCSSPKHPFQSFFPSSVETAAFDCSSSAAASTSLFSSFSSASSLGVEFKNSSFISAAFSYACLNSCAFS